MKRKIASLIILFIIFSIFVPTVLAQVPAPQDPFTLLSNGLKTVFSFSWAQKQADFLATLRALIFFFLFIVYYSVFKMLGNANPQFNWMAQRPGLGLSLILAFMSVLFMPAKVMVGAGVQYGQIGALVLFIPVLGLSIYLLRMSIHPWLKAGICLMLMYMMWWIAYNSSLTAIHYAGIAGTGYIIIPMLPYLIRRFK